MKKFLLSLASFALMFGAANADDVVIQQCLFGTNYNSKSVQNYTSSWTATNKDFTWDIVNFNNNQNGWDFVKCGGKTANTATITTQSPIATPVTKVGFLISAVSSTNNITSVSLLVADNSSFTNAKEYPINKTANADSEQIIEIENPAANLYYQFTATCTAASSNGLITLNQITYYGDGEGGDTTDPDPGTDPEPGPGTDPEGPVEVVEVTFDFTKDAYGLPNDNNTYVTSGTTISQNGVEITFGTTNSAWRMWSDGLRTYASQKCTFTVSYPGGKVTNVSWTGTPTFALDGTSNNITSWSGSNESVTFIRTGSGNTAVKTITVKVEKVGNPDLVTPVLSFPENAYSVNFGETFSAPALTVNPEAAASLVTYSSSDENVATVAADGSVTILYPGTTKITASIAEDKTYNAASATYILNVKLSGITVAEALYYISEGYNGNATVKGIISEITEISTSYGNATYLIKDALTDTSALTVYRGYWMNGEKFTTGTEIEVGGTVEVSGQLVNYNGTYEFTTGNQVISYEAPEKSYLPVPTFTPNGGTIEAGSEITISCSVEGATIVYSINDDEMEDAQDAPSPVSLTINETSTIKAYAMMEGYEKSDIATVTFTVLAAGTKIATFDFTNPEELNPAQARPASGEGTEVPGVTFTNNGVKFAVSETAEGKTAPRIWSASGQNAGKLDLRLYLGESFLISVDETEYHITEIAFTKYTGSYNMEPTGGLLTTNGNDAVWTPEDDTNNGLISDVRFDMTGTSNIQTVTVTYVPGAGITTGVESVVAEQDAPVVYYNLQGVRVQNPANGLYIRVQGNNVDKVLVK